MTTSSLSDCEKRLKETSEKGSVLFESKFKKADGILVDVEISARITDWEKGTVQGIVRDITRRKKTEGALKSKEEELTERSHRLQEVNSALEVLLKKREDDKGVLQENLLFHVKRLVFPYVDQLKQGRLNEDQMRCVDLLEENLKNVISPLAGKLSAKYLALTPTEIRIADLVRSGRTNKEIVQLLAVSENTVKTHRFNIRNKLGLKNEKTNLRTYLSFLTK